MYERNENEKKIVVIDAAHGGEDTGTSNNDIVEKDFNLEITKYIRDKLKNSNIEVYLTREEDILLPEEQRISNIKEKYPGYKNIILLSNRLSDGTDDGAEITYALRNDDTLARLIATSLESKGQNVNKYFQRRLPSDLASDYDYIIRLTNPYESIIVRYGYPSSVGDDKNILKNNISSLGDAVVSALLQYLKKEGIYIVKSGDTLYNIAKKYNTTVDEIKKVNNLSSNNLTIGAELIIPSTSSTINTYTVQKGDSLYAIAKKYNTTVSAIKTLNNLTSDILTVGTILKLPSLKEEYNIVIIKSGDTLYNIAKKYNTTVDKIKSLNSLTSNVLSIGQNIKIPEDVNYEVYTVERGDTLYSIAKKYNIEVTSLKNYNNLASNNLSIGQKIKVPISKIGYKNYIVKSGDTLYSIARDNNITVNQLKSANNLTSNILSIGMILKLPST